MQILKSPLITIAKLQNMRFPWALMGLTALLMNLIAYYIFQEKMSLSPCELCVYIRFGMFCIFFGSIFTFINPKNLFLRIFFGYILSGYGIIQGALWNHKLSKIYKVIEGISKGGDFFALGGGKTLCSLYPSFPLNMPLDQVFPSWFAPKGLCGDAQWFLFGFNMSECLYLFYFIYLVAFFLMLLSFIKYGIKSYQ